MLTTALALTLAATVPSIQPQAAQPRSVLEHKGPINRWDEGFPIGNGLFGVLAWGGPAGGPTGGADKPTILRLSLDRGDLWDTRLPAVFNEPGWTYANMVALKEARNHREHVRLFDVPYDTIAYPTKLPVGRVEISFPIGETLTDWSLTTGSRSIRLRYDHPGSSSPLTITVHDDEPLVTCMSLPGDATATLIRPKGLDTLNYPAPVTGKEGDTQWFVQRTTEGLEYAVVISISTSKPKHEGQPSIRTLAAAVKTNRESPDPLRAARDLVEKATDFYGQGSALRQKPHALNFNNPDSSSVSLPDPRLQLHYDLCKHFYTSASRDGAPPIPLQGVWTADEGGLPPWKGDYHNDLNTQMTYLAYPTAGLFSQGAAWINFNLKLRPAYEKFAKSFYSVNGLVVPGVMTIDGQPMGGWGQYSLSPTHTAWIAHNIYQHWRFTMDKDALARDWYPWCAHAGEALLAIGKVDDQGRFRLPLSTSPEIHDNSFAAWLKPNSNYDLSLLRFLFAANAEMADALRRETDAARWRAALKTCEPLNQSPTGLNIAAGTPFNQSHRHFSHAMAVFPLGTLNTEQGAAEHATIDATIAQLDKLGTKAWCGYSFAWMSAMCARAGKPDLALRYLTDYLAFTGPNGFHLNGDQTKSGLSDFTYRPFTLEGNFIAMAAIHEMLLQSWGEVGRNDSSTLRIFPAVSDKWQDVSFTDLHAEGGFVVSAARKAGTTVRVKIAATRDGTLRLRDPFTTKAEWSRAWSPDSGLYTAKLNAGETIEGHAVEAAPDKR